MEKSEEELDRLYNERWNRMSASRDMVEELSTTGVFSTDDRHQFFRAFNHVAAAQGTSGDHPVVAAFFSGLAPQLEAVQSGACDTTDVLDYMRTWEILTAYVNQIAPERHDPLGWIEECCPDLQYRGS